MVSRSLSSRRNASRVPSGCHAGRLSSPGPLVTRRATPVAGSRSQSQPRAAMAMVAPSGEGAGSVGPAATIGSSNPSTYTWWEYPSSFG